MTEEETRAKIKQLVANGDLDAKTLAAEAELKRQAAGTQGNAQRGQSCACWRGQLCRYHNLMYHGVT